MEDFGDYENNSESGGLGWKIWLIIAIVIILIIIAVFVLYFVVFNGDNSANNGQEEDNQTMTPTPQPITEEAHESTPAPFTGMDEDDSNGSQTLTPVPGSPTFAPTPASTPAPTMECRITIPNSNSNTCIGDPHPSIKYGQEFVDPSNPQNETDCLARAKHYYETCPKHHQVSAKWTDTGSVKAYPTSRCHIKMDTFGDCAMGKPQQDKFSIFNGQIESDFKIPEQYNSDNDITGMRNFCWSKAKDLSNQCKSSVDYQLHRSTYRDTVHSTNPNVAGGYGRIEYVGDTNAGPQKCFIKLHPGSGNIQCNSAANGGASLLDPNGNRLNTNVEFGDVSAKPDNAASCHSRGKYYFDNCGIRQPVTTIWKDNNGNEIERQTYPTTYPSNAEWCKTKFKNYSPGDCYSGFSSGLSGKQVNDQGETYYAFSGLADNSFSCANSHANLSGGFCNDKDFEFDVYRGQTLVDHVDSAYNL